MFSLNLKNQSLCPPGGRENTLSPVNFVLALRDACTEPEEEGCLIFLFD